MKIVDRKTFMSLPAGTLFMKYEPCVFEDLCVKADSIPNDFFYTQITHEIDTPNGGFEAIDALEKSLKDGTSVPLDFDAVGRDGGFADGQLFAVYEKADVAGLIAKLQACLETYKEKVELYLITEVKNVKTVCAYCSAQATWRGKVLGKEFTFVHMCQTHYDAYGIGSTEDVQLPEIV